ncbi:MAG: NADH:ubiquinone oxidoreductase, partial [Proteobacteria bacterium]|nr:NADH:ubiquinone oxidoreductase [Pseudomonadota bacterium]
MNLSNHIPILIIAIPLLAAFLVPLISRISKKATGILTTLALSVSLILTIMLAVKILTVGPQVYVFGATSPSLALPSGLKFPIRIMLQIDAMSIFMGLITAVVSFLGAIYSLSFLKKYDGVDKYYSLLLLLTVGMFGMEFTGDIFNFFVFLEIASIAS